MRRSIIQHRQNLMRYFFSGSDFLVKDQPFWIIPFKSCSWRREEKKKTAFPPHKKFFIYYFFKRKGGKLKERWVAQWGGSEQTETSKDEEATVWRPSVGEEWPWMSDKDFLYEWSHWSAAFLQHGDSSANMTVVLQWRQKLYFRSGADG